ncbi:60S ribosomal protein L17-like [Dioscorea cayenensis subsp. rotundata]|uniref:60S ribosomal protein L17-like n=1 Tax=Dioscorea cayennensis subsp. rotundata TaxID=55577 RepID=A0AB40B0Q3_DIOCR|nr:60S ribosomal protein L17-like [Dioscorea cayenensis subsp. rotundata]
MVKCLRESENPTNSSKAMGRGLRAHFKNTRGRAVVIGKLPLLKAKRYFDDVIAYEQAVSSTRYCRGVGCTALAKNHHPNGLRCWPVKSTR